MIRVARVAMAAGLSLPVIASGQQIVDLDAVSDCRLRETTGGIELFLDPGLYLTTPVGPAGGGAFTAFNKWDGEVRDCAPAGYECAAGWVTQHDVRDDEANRLGHPVGDGYQVIAETPELALAMPARQFFRVCEATTVYITIYDSNCSDNVGGVSVQIDPVCMADINHDGDTDFFDFLEFQSLFAAESALGDVDCDGEFTFFDFLAFQNQFAQGCP